MSELRGYDAWIRTLVDQDLPTLNCVVKDICSLSVDDECRADDLTKIILRDANLTSKVLKVANSVYYNRSFVPIKTVSRAIVQLGFENLKNITLATSLIDGFLKGKPKTLLIESLAKSFHAAVQARALVPKLSAEQKEQVFIATLLNNIGELALLASGREEAEIFVAERNSCPENETTISERVLGVDIQDITKGLISEWSLNELICELGEEYGQPSLITRAVNLGSEISKYMHTGMNSIEMARIYTQISAMCNLSLIGAKNQVKQIAEEAAVIAKSYDVDALLAVLPRALESEKEPKHQKTGYEFQHSINEIHKILMDGGDISKIMQASVNALHEDSAIPRVAIAMLDYKSKALDFRYVSGPGTHIWRQSIHIELDKLSKQELLLEFLRAQQSIWYKPAQMVKPLGALEPLENLGDIMMAPLKIDKRLVAILYADGNSDRLSLGAFENFQVIANQLNLMMKVQAVQAGPH